MPDYLTWEQLKDALNGVTDPCLLAEPVLFTYLNNYGDTTAYPVQLLPEGTHPEERTHTLCVTESEEWEMTYNLDPEDLADFGLRALRSLPLGGLKLGYSDMDEDAEDCTAWLAQPNPHTPPPAPVPEPAPGPAPLFE
jgi:hypothetical protein